MLSKALLHSDAARLRRADRSRAGASEATQLENVGDWAIPRTRPPLPGAAPKGDSSLSEAQFAVRSAEQLQLLRQRRDRTTEVSSVSEASEPGGCTWSASARPAIRPSSCALSA